MLANKALAQEFDSSCQDAALLEEINCSNNCENIDQKITDNNLVTSHPLGIIYSDFSHNCINRCTNDLTARYDSCDAQAEYFQTQ